jgi:hypothetical protein
MTEEAEVAVRITVDEQVVLELEDSYAMEFEYGEEHGPWLKVEWGDYSRQVPEAEERPITARLLLSTWHVVNWVLAFIPNQLGGLRGGSRRGAAGAHRMFVPWTGESVVRVEVPGRSPLVVTNEGVSVDASTELFRLEGVLQDGRKVEIHIPTAEVTVWGAYVLNHAAHAALAGAQGLEVSR